MPVESRPRPVPVAKVEGKPWCSKLIAVEETEMPRSRSTAIQSERVRRRAPRAFPLERIAAVSGLTERTAPLNHVIRLERASDALVHFDLDGCVTDPEALVQFVR